MGRLLESNGRTIVENDFANKVKTQDKEVFIHPLADVHTKNIGNKTKVWQFSVILEKARIGGNCNINSHTFIENNVVIGDNVTIKCGVYLWDGVRIKDDVFIGPNVTFTNDKYPKSKNYPDEYQEVIIEEGASIGANSTVLGGVRIGQGSMIGAGSVVSKNVPEGELWVGNPARFVRKMEQAKVLPVIEDKLKEVEV
ncbi:MAG: dTDP-6-deoxy-3,4-keto-hexulose isomerase [Maribacter sp.]|nr:MAG: dTDP-6-deoxy-3,4-keto-hexulose isomerase [Maribacter sp.]